MGNAFSAITGQIGKTFAIGALLPATVFVLLSQLFIVPMAPLEPRVLPILRSIDTQWRLGLVVALSAVLATLLYVLNGSILRLYQGYGWRFGILGSWLTERHRQELRALEDLRDELRDLMDAASADEKRFGELASRYLSVTQPILNEFPKMGSVLPTRLGNTIRSFENYAQRQYRIAGITAWPRFVPKLTKEHAAMIDDAKSAVDLVINISVLSYVTLLVTLFLGVAFPVPFADFVLFRNWLLRMTVFFAIGYGFYLASITLARTWGESVRAAFDLHRRAVLHDLGFEQAPETLEEEKDLWEAISQQLVYGEVVTADSWRYKDRKSAPQPLQPAEAKLEMSRGVTMMPDARVVTVWIRNLGNEAVENATLSETLDDKREYIWNSARLNDGLFAPKGANPLVFTIPRLEAWTSAVITYATTL